MTAVATGNPADGSKSIAAWRAFKHLCEWAWICDLPHYIDEDTFSPHEQVIGFGGSHIIDMLRTLAEDFTQDLTEDALADLIEIALEKQLAEYDLGLTPQQIYGAMEMEYVRVMHFYTIGDEKVARTTVRAAQKTAMRNVLDEAGLL